jgi:hypothetical protein
MRKIIKACYFFNFAKKTIKNDLTSALKTI